MRKYHFLRIYIARHLGIVLCLMVGMITSAWGNGQTVGNEFRVNATTADAQQNPAVADDDTGNYVVVWASKLIDPDIYAQRYNALGVAQGGEFLVNTTTTDAQKNPVIAMDSDGDFVIAWQSNLQDGDNDGIYAQRYNALGVAQGGEFLVNATTAGAQRSPAIAMDSDGDFVIAWQSNDSSNFGIYAQRYNASGVAQGGEFLANTTTSGAQLVASIAMDSDGDFVIAWKGTPSGNTNIYAQRYNASGVAQGSEFLVNTYTPNDQQSPSVAMGSNGDFVIAWQSLNQDLSDNGVYAQRYNASGVEQGIEFRVNTYTTNSQSASSVAMNGDGDFVIAWRSDGQDTSDFGVYAQCYEASGAPKGVEFRVNTEISGAQTLPSVAMDNEGDFVVVWQSDGQDGDNLGIYAQAYQYAVEISAPNVTAQYSTTIDVPIQIGSDVTGDGIVASEISVTYRNDMVLSAVTSLTTLAGTVTTNSMVYQGWSVEENVFAGAAIDTLKIAMSTAQDTLTGQGDLIYLTLQVADVRSPNTTSLELVNVLFNDGIPAANATVGSLIVTGTDATISTAPDSIRPSESVSITLTDVDLGLDVGVAEQVSVTAFSVTYSDSQYVTLTETGVNTGEFTGSVATEFSAVAGTPQDGVIGTIAGDSIGVVAIDVLTSAGITSPLYAFPVRVYGGVDGVVAVSYVVQALDGRNGVRDTVRVQVADVDLDLDVGSAESVSATITNAISGESESVTLTETGVNTGVFQIRVPSVAGASGTNNDGVLSLASWDTLNVSYVDSLTSQGGVSPVGDITRVVNAFGDVQPNDNVQAFDAARLLAISVGLISSNTQTTLVGDVDGGGVITAYDASLVLQYVVRLIDRFLVQTDFTADPKNHPFEKPVVSQMLALGEMSQQSDGTYLVPVQLFEREGVLSGTLTFGMDAGIEVVGADLVNAYGSFMVAHNATDEGLKVAFAGSKSELSGSGDVLMLKMRGVEGTPIRLSLDQVILNGQSLTPSVNIEAMETVEAPALTFVTALHQNLPNPFNPETTIRYGLADAGEVNIVIYSVTGQRVRTLVRAFQDAGAYQVTWNGQDALGRQVSSGVYLMRMQADGFLQTRKMMFLK